MKLVEPLGMSGLNVSLTCLWGRSPKFTVTCGSCASSWRTRVAMHDHPIAKCPDCGAANRLPLIVSEGLS
jgi:RNase P subunit RPR2